MIFNRSVLLFTLLVLSFTACLPTLVCADDNEFLVKFGEAYAQASMENGGDGDDDDREVTREKVPPIAKVLKVGRQLAETFGLVAGLASLVLFLFLTHLAFFCFTLFMNTQKPEHMDDIAILVRERPWKTLGLGILNYGLAIIVIAILFKPGLKIFGFLFLSWFMAKLLEAYSAKAIELGGKIYRGEEERFPIRAAVGALVYWPIFLVPVYGQVTFILTMFRGLGAQVWLKFRPRSVPATTDVEIVEVKDETEKTKEEIAASDTVVKEK